MHSRKQLHSFKKKKRPKLKNAGYVETNKEFAKIARQMIKDGNLKKQDNLVMGGEFAAAEVMSALGYELVDRPVNYSYCTDPANSETKKILNNKNILSNELINQENEKIDASEYFSDSEDPIFSVDIESREIKQSAKFTSTNNPSVEIKIDLTEVVVGMANLYSPLRNGGLVFDTDFVKKG